MKGRGKLNTVCNEMDRYDLQFLGIAETNWNGQGSFKTCTNHTVLFPGSEEGYSHGAAVILTRETSNALIGYSPISDRIINVRIQAKPHNITFIQCYAPTSLASDKEIDSFHNSLQETMDSIPNRDIKVVMGDFNAKVGQGSTNVACGKFGLGKQNIRGEDLLKFCSSNNLTIANTLFQKHPRHLYTWISPDNRTRNQIDYITLSQKWKSNIKNVRTRPGADCNSDHQLLWAEIRFQLKKMEHPLPPIRLDYNAMGPAYRITVENKFETLLQCEEEKSAEKLWNEGKKSLSALPKRKFPRKKEKNVSGSQKRPYWQWRKGENRKPEESITKLMKQTTDTKMPMSKG